MANNNPNQEGLRKEGAPKGNQNAKKGSAWRNELRQVLETYSDDEVAAGEALNRIAIECVKDALYGTPREKIAAREEIANRLDGKVAQELIHSGDEDRPAVRLLING